MTHQLCTVALKIHAGPDVEDEALEKLTLRLQRELTHLEGVESVQRIHGAFVPMGAKATEAIMLDGLAVEVLGEKIVDLIGRLRDWSQRKPGDHEIEIITAAHSLVIDATMPQEKLQDVADFVKNTLA